MSNYRNILVAIDFSPESSQVVQRAAELANQGQATLTLLYVIEPIVPAFADDGMMAVDIQLEDELRRDAAERLAMLKENHSLPNARTLIEQGVPKHEIVRVAKESDADLILVGSHGRHGLQLLLGSTANGVLHLASCDVLAVRIVE